MIAFLCSHCQSPDVIRFGRNRNGTPRGRCKSCDKTFTLETRSRAVTAPKQAAIEAALAEHISQRGIARVLHVSRLTIRNLRKKTQTA